MLGMELHWQEGKIQVMLTQATLIETLATISPHPEDEGIGGKRSLGLEKVEERS